MSLQADPAPDSFLDQPVPEALIPASANPGKSKSSFPFLEFKSFADRMTNLQAVVQCPVVYPNGFAHFIQTEDGMSNWDKGNVLFSTERDGSPAGNTKRGYLSSSLQAMNLTWTYDPVSKSINVDFGWHRDDPRSSLELVQVLTRTRPPPADELIRQSILKEKDESANSWLVAFDALLSRPENFPRVWKLRFLDDARRVFEKTYVDNLLSGIMYDERGTEHLVVLDDQPEFVSPGEGSLCYYVFDSSGKFDAGAILNSGHRCENTSAWFDAWKHKLTLQTYFNGKSAEAVTFTLRQNRLIPVEPRDAFGADLGIGKTIYEVGPP